VNEDPTLPPALQPDFHIAERVRNRMETFPRKFRELGEGNRLANLLRKTQTLEGAPLEQAPEVFTKQYLIEPVLDGLGYLNPVSEAYAGDGPHFIREPSTYDGVEPRRPDYLLKNIDSSATCIVEAKAANRERMDGAKRWATKGIDKYLKEDTFCRYLRTVDLQYLIGIGTDGLRWTLWVKDLETDQTVEACPKVDISPAIDRIARRLDVIDGDLPDNGGTEVEREMLYDEFVPAFATANLLDHAKTVLG